MADYSDSVINDRSVFPELAIDGQDWGRVEPLLTVKQLEKRFLFGIPLVSPVINPRTKRHDVKDEDDLKEHILRAVAKVELMMGVDIFPVQRDERAPFDRAAVDTYNYIRTQHKPVLSVDKLSIMPSNLGDAYVFPGEWISKAYFTRGQINFTPLLTPTNGNDAYLMLPNSNLPNSSSWFLSKFTKSWLPAYWRIIYTTGFPEARLPRVINEIIGMQAAIDICTDIAASFRFTSHSLSIDGMSQSQSGPGPDIYLTKIKELKEQMEPMLQKLKAQFNVKFAVAVA